jgi:hypothetical protein
MIWLDFETRSRCDLPSRGVYNYAQDASTEVLCMSYAFDDGEVATWLPGQPFPDITGHQIMAHNAAFERLIFWYVLCPDIGVPEPSWNSSIVRQHRRVPTASPAVWKT